VIQHIVIGLLSAFLIAFFSKTDHSWQLYVGCIICSTWPDFDSLLHLIVLRFKKGAWRGAWQQATGKWAHEHRNILHIPLLVPFVSVAIAILSPFWSLMFLVISMTHFIMDSFGIGWGIRWLYPFSKKNYKFFYNKTGVFDTSSPIVSWTPDELCETVEEQGDPNWLKKKRSWA